MFSTIKTRAGTVVIRSALIGEVMPLFEKTIQSLNTQADPENLLCWLVDVFSDDFAEQYGKYSDDYLSKFVLCVLNIRHFLIHDKEQFCKSFNAENMPVRIGFEDAFYPRDIGHWIDRNEFVLTNAH